MSDELTQPNERRLSVIMFSDIVGYSKMMQDNEDLAMDLLTRHNAIIREILKRNDGSEIKVIGDAFLVSFSTVANAVRCAIEIQEKFSKYNEGREEREKIQVRIGIHLGDIIIKENDVFGDGVNIASRIEPLAEPGGICISQEIYNLVKQKLDFQVVSLGPRELKNIKDKIEIYQILVGSIVGEGRQSVRFRSKLRQWKYAVPLIAGTLCIISALIYFYFQSQSQKQTTQILSRPLKVRALDVNYPNISSDGNWVVYVAGFSFQNIYVEHISGGESRKVTNDTIWTLKSSPCFSPDGSKIAYEAWNGDTSRFVGDIYIIPTLGGRSQKIIDSAELPLWSPDGRFLAFYRHEKSIWALREYEFEGGKETKIADTKSTFFNAAWSPDSKKITFLRGFTSATKKDYTEIFMLDLANGEEHQLTDDKNIIDDFCWTTNNDIIFNSTRGGSVNLWMIPVSGGPPRQITLGNGNDRCPRISKDGKHLIYINESQSLNVWTGDLETRKTSQLTFEEGGCYGASFSPDGNKIAYLQVSGVFQTGSLELIICNKDGSEPKNIRLGKEGYSLGRWDPLQWSADGNQLAFSVSRSDTINGKPDSVKNTPNILLLDLLTNKIKKIGEGRLFAWSPDEKYMLYMPEGKNNINLLVSTKAFGKTIREIRTRRFSSFSRDSKNIFYTDSMGIWIINIQDSSTKLLLKSKDLPFNTQETPDTKAIVFLNWNFKTNVWNVKSLSKSSKTLTTLFELPAGIFVPIYFSSDMKTIMYTKEQTNNKIMMIDNLY